MVKKSMVDLADVAMAVAVAVVAAASLWPVLMAVVVVSARAKKSAQVNQRRNKGAARTLVDEAETLRLGAPSDVGFDARGVLDDMIVVIGILSSATGAAFILVSYQEQQMKAEPTDSP